MVRESSPEVNFGPTLPTGSWGKSNLIEAISMTNRSTPCMLGYVCEIT